MEQVKAECVSLVEKFLISSPAETQELFLKLCSCIEAFANEVVSLKKLSQQNVALSLVFQFTQIISSLEFLVTILQKEKEINVILNECRKAACNRITFCVNRIEECFTEERKFINDFGLFLRWMDNALDHVAKIDVSEERYSFLSTMEGTRKLYEDILSHAMSIAQVCLGDDRNIIQGSCGSVFEVLGELERELNEDQLNKAMVSLFIEDVSNKLCALERKVDLAILKLSLFVFSNYYKTLEELYNYCKNDHETASVHKEVHKTIFDFDLHSDRIFQIGLFAVYCSSNVKSGIKIRNCLASLEFLEPELVPALKMLLKDTSAVTKESALIYKDYWTSEADKLKILVFEIIDPSAFCKVIHDEITLGIHTIIEKQKEKKEFRKTDFVNIFNYGKVLMEFLLTVVKIEGITDGQLKDKIWKCNIITSEIGAGIDILDGNDMVNHERLLKRCRILQSQVKKVLSLLNNSDKKEGISKRNEFDENAADEKQNKATQNSFSRIICQGREILENRSVLYRTPKKKVLSQFKYGDPEITDSVIEGISLPKMHFSFRSLDKKSTSMRANVDFFCHQLSELKSTFIGEQE